MGMPKGQPITPLFLKDRRLAARSLLIEGLPQAEVARRTGVSRQSVSRWARLPTASLSTVKRQGRKSKLTQAMRTELIIALATQPEGTGISLSEWKARELKRLLADRFGLHYSAVHVWRLLRQL